MIGEANLLDTDIFESIDDMGVPEEELVLYCNNGILESYSLYVNTSREGEKFGSGDPDLYDITTRIEDAGLDDEHLLILYHQKIYKMCDLGSESGTWVNTDHTFEEVEDGM